MPATRRAVLHVDHMPPLPGPYPSFAVEQVALPAGLPSCLLALFGLCSSVGLGFYYYPV